MLTIIEKDTLRHVCYGGSQHKTPTLVVTTWSPKSDSEHGKG